MNLDLEATIRFAAAFGAALVALHARENSRFRLAERVRRRAPNAAQHLGGATRVGLVTFRDKSAFVLLVVDKHDPS